MAKVFVLGLVIGFGILNITGCGKTCVEATYNFTMTEQFNPETDSIKVGDTLWVVSSHSTTFKDISTSNDIDYSNSKVNLNMRLLNFTDSTIVASGNIGAFPDFNTVIVEGTAVGNDNLPDQNEGVYFEESDNQFLLKVAFRPKQKGIYAISLGDAVAERRNHGCELAYINVANSNNDNHLFYYQDSRPGYQISGYESTHLYCFKVY